MSGLPVYVTDCQECHRKNVGVTRDWNLSKDRRENPPWRVARHGITKGSKVICQAGSRIEISDELVRRRINQGVSA